MNAALGGVPPYLFGEVDFVAVVDHVRSEVLQEAHLLRTPGQRVDLGARAHSNLDRGGAHTAGRPRDQDALAGAELRAGHERAPRCHEHQTRGCRLLRRETLWQF